MLLFGDSLDSASAHTEIRLHHRITDHDTLAKLLMRQFCMTCSDGIVHCKAEARAGVPISGMSKYKRE